VLPLIPRYLGQNVQAAHILPLSQDLSKVHPTACVSMTMMWCRQLSLLFQGICWTHLHAPEGFWFDLNKPAYSLVINVYYIQIGHVGAWAV